MKVGEVKLIFNVINVRSMDTINPNAGRRIIHLILLKKIIKLLNCSWWITSQKNRLMMCGYWTVDATTT